MKHLFKIFTTLLFFSSALPLSADVVELKNGQMLEVVILSEDETSYKAQLNVGSITISKDTVVKITEYSFEDNRKLLENWKSTKKAKRKQRAEERMTEAPIAQPKTKEVRYVRYGDKWITEEEYRKIKEEKQLTWEEKIDKEKNRVRALTNEEQEARLYELTKELIIQGTKRRSNEANRILTFHEWKHIQTDHFIIFHDNDKTGELIQDKAEYYLRRIATDLDIAQEFDDYIKEKRRFEIYVVEEKDVWEDALKGKFLPDTPNGFSKIYKREIFLFIEDEGDVDTILPHELSHLLLRAYVDLNYGTDALIPLWLNEGFANYQGNILNMGAAEEILRNAIRKSEHHKLGELVSINQYPKRTDEKMLIYAQATKMVQFITVNYGRNTFLEFIDVFIDTYNTLMNQNGKVDKRDGKDIFRKALRGSSLKREFVSPSAFEETWLKNILE